MILRGKVFSETLGMETGLSIIAPEHRRDSSYKVIYLLHGLCGSSGDMIDYTMLPTFAAEHDIVFVLPEVGRSFYTDMKYGLPYFSYITKELPRICQDVFRISAKRELTGVIGGSMGGYGALKAALSYPEQYGFCGAFASACLYLKEALDEQRQFGDTKDFKEKYGVQVPKDFLAAFGPELLWQKENEIIELAKAIYKEKDKPFIYAACGRQDPFLETNIRFKTAMDLLDYDFTYDEWDGKHDWHFFNTAIERALKKFVLRVQTR